MADAEITVTVQMHRHRTHRRHSTFIAQVPLEFLTDPLYFTAHGEATGNLDQWMCDNGEEVNVDYSDDGNPDAEDLSYEVAEVGPVMWP